MSDIRIHAARQWRALPLIAGAGLWLWAGLQASLWGAIVLVPLALLMLSAAISAWLYPGHPRQHHLLALLAFVSLLLLPVFGFAVGWASLGLALVAVLMALGAGWLSIVEQLVVPGIPLARSTPKLAAKVALDDALLGYFIGTAEVPGPHNAYRIAEEMLSADRIMRAKGWTTNSAQYHQEPAAPDQVTVREAKVFKHPYFHVRWRSDFEPRLSLPGAERYAQYEASQWMHGWMLRHEDGPRPWLMAIHGYRMGIPALDFSLFSPRWFHERLGLNVFMPVLPLHGPRSIGRRSGDGYLGGEFMDLVHAQTQALFDLRASVRWLQHDQGADHIGVLGYSLGGYNASLLAAYEAELDCVIAGIPLVDVADALWRHFPVLPRRSVEALGVSEEMLNRVMRPLSPLSRPSMVRSDRCAVFGALADQLVPPAQVAALANHWGLDAPVWYRGSHMSVRREAMGKYAIERALLSAGMIETTDTAPKPLIR